MATVSSTGTTNTSTGSSIISALGSGSGINTSALVGQLVEVNKAPQLGRLTTRQTLLETQISDFGLLRSAFSTLETAASVLGNADTFNAKSASIPTTTLLGITKLDAKASVGDYSITVEQIAQAQSVSTSNFSSQTTAIGKGTLTIRFGSWNAGVDTFTVDSAKTGGTITIDDSNNSLTGLRDTINKSSLGVKAAIVSEGGYYKLLVTGPSGASSEVEITAVETVGAEGLASFNFNQTTRNLTQQQEGKDALLHVNGMSLSRSTNHLTDVIDGMEFDLFNKSTTETVSIGISEDKSIAEKNIRDFVAAYNTFLTASEKLVGFDKEKNAYGSLRQDPLAKNLVQQVRSQLSATMTGLTGSFTSLSDIGVGTQLDGTLKINDTTDATSFRSAIDKNFAAVRDLFIPTKTSTNAQITVTKHTDSSVAGSYEVNITQQPKKGSLTSAVMVATFPLDTTGKTYSFTAGVDGIDTASITLPTKTYASGAALAADLQSLINADANITAAKVSVNVLFNSTTKKLEFTSTAYGSGSKVSFSAVSTDMADIGIIVGSGTSGNDVGGTVGGVAAFGYGNVLLPALGSKAEGLNMTVEPGATSGTITFSRGFGGSFTRLINDFLKSNGMIKTREASITKDVDKVKKDQVALDRRSEAYRLRLQSQFSAMESIVRSLKSTGTFLTGAFKALSGNNNQ